MAGKYKHENYINRELSWLEFNERVLEEAFDKKNNPLFERLKFLSIVSSNLDEFFMVRVASLYDQVLAGFRKPDISGITPEEQVRKISARVHEMVEDQYDCYNKHLIRQLKMENINFLKPDDLDENQIEYVRNYYNRNIYPVITPMVVDQSRPFPLVLNKSLNIALMLENSEDKAEKIFGTVQVPSVLGRFIKLPSTDEFIYYILLEDVIKMFIDTLFTGHNVLTICCYRITRNADQSLDEEGAEDLLQAIEQFLKKRKWGRVIRLEVERDMNKNLLDILVKEFDVPAEGIYSIDGPLDITFLMKIGRMKFKDKLNYEAYVPQQSPDFFERDIFEIISEKDILVHHPFESFDPVIEMVQRASRDPGVLAIKQTLYRVSGKSPIVEALAQAAENGKQVTVLVELKARFDEENNILWAKRLEMAGCHVIYGLLGLKTHCKILLIVKREEEGIKRYVHMGTGNYNDVTAKLYTDMGLFTSNLYVGADISSIFNMLSGYSKPTKLYKVVIAPVDLRAKFIELINNEIKIAKEGKRARIITKLNSLVDEEIIDNLYDASCAGVEIDLIVRGICCLTPGIKDVSENIRVRSIVGRYLEHTRIYYFSNAGDELIYLSSADWMNRNLDGRVELLFPVENPKLQKRLLDILEVYLDDSVKARLMNSDGTYTRVSFKGDEQLNSQEYFTEEAVKKMNEVITENEEQLKNNAGPGAF